MSLSPDQIINLNSYVEQDFVFSLCNDLGKIDWFDLRYTKTNINIVLKHCQTISTSGIPDSPLTIIKTISNCEVERLKRYRIPVNSIDGGEDGGNSGGVSLETEELIFVDGGELGI